MSTGKIFLGIVAGVAAGALVGILYAPDKGSRTRRKIVMKGEELRDDIKDRFTRLGDYISDRFDGTKEAARDLIESGRSKVHEVKKEAKPATN